MSMYYGNQKCKVIAELEHEVVIELLIGEVMFDGGSYEEPPCIEPYHTKIIVDKRHLSKTPLTSKDIIAEKQRAIREANKEVETLKRTTQYEINNTKREAEKELKEIRGRVEKLESNGLIEYLNFLEGKYEWFINLGYGTRICKFGEDDLSSGSILKPELCAISFRSKDFAKQNDGSLYLSIYGDDSGSSRSEIKCFATLDEAKHWLINQVETGKIEPRRLAYKSQNKYPITSPKIEEYKAEQKAQDNEQISKNISRLEKDLAEAKSRVTPAPNPLPRGGK